MMYLWRILVCMSDNIVSESYREVAKPSKVSKILNPDKNERIGLEKKPGNFHLRLCDFIIGA